MILEQIHASGDTAKLTQEQIPALAAEIRQFLLEHVSRTGGHLAANLGVVELTIALHRCFDVNYDRIVWDVGHQIYTHKLLTGRRERFGELRKLDGLSGFPKTQEDPSDAFNTGHSSTSVSAATGFAVAARAKGENRCAVAVIGDGALTGGMAFEALNHAGSMKIPLIVVLNDNGMSISKSVGGLSGKLKKIRNSNRYDQFKNNMKWALDKIPVVGTPLKRRVIAVKKALKPLIVRNEFFEDLGFTYLGPVDGHNVEKLEVILNIAKNKREPVLIHVLTKKGKGYTPAEKNPDFFHGVTQFDSKTGQPVKQELHPDWSAEFGNLLCEFAKNNPKIMAVTAAMPLGTGLETFRKKFPGRFFDVGIAEQHAVTFAAGMAKSGLVPCFAVYSTFLQRGYDQLLHDVALQGLHVVFCIDRSGPVGADGETHQGVFDISYLSHMPGFTILSPADDWDLKQMLDFALNRCKGPVAIRYPRGAVPLAEPSRDKPGSAVENILRREGKDILIAAVGCTLPDALAAAELLEKQGISVAVLQVRAVKPLDMASLLIHSQGKKIVASLEDNVVTGGFGEQLTAALQRKVRIFAYPDQPIVQGSVPELKEKYGLSPEQIARELQKLVVV